MFQDSPSYNSWLTEYAQGSYADEADSIGRILFPPVKVSTRVGKFAKRDISNAFRVYNTKLTRGNTPTRIDINSVKGFFDVDPHALEVGTWKFDMEQDGGGSDEREDALQDLMSTQLVTREFEAINLWKKDVAKTTGCGIWKGEAGANADPIDELDQLALKILYAIGKKPSHLIFGLNAWRALKNHPSLRARVQGLSVPVTPQHVKELMLFGDVEIIVSSMVYQPGKRGKKADMTGIMDNDVFMLHNQDAPTRGDMSASKDFTLDPAGPEVLSSEDDRKMEIVDSLYWSTDRQVTCPAAAGRLEVA